MNNTPNIQEFVESKTDNNVVNKVSYASENYSESDQSSEESSEEKDETEELENLFKTLVQNIEIFKTKAIETVRENPEMKASMKSFNEQLKKATKCKPPTFQTIMATFGKEQTQPAKAGRKKGPTITVSGVTRARRQAGAGTAACSPGVKRKPGVGSQEGFPLPSPKKKSPMTRTLSEAISQNKPARKKH